MHITALHLFATEIALELFHCLGIRDVCAKQSGEHLIDFEIFD